MHARLACAAALLLMLTLMLASAIAAAQPAPRRRAPAQPAAEPLAQRLDKLAEQVDEALKAAADLPMALKALQDLQNQVTALQQQVRTSRTVVEGFDAMRRKLDHLDERVSDMELRLSALRLQLAGDRQRTAGFDDGFFIRRADRAFLLRIGTLLQSAYVGRIFSESRRLTGTAIGQDESTFVLRRARLRLAGHAFHPSLSYEVELDWGSVDPGRPLLEMYGNLQIVPALQLSGGKMKVPFARQFLVHSAQQLFVERSGAVEAFAPQWDLGVMLHGELLRRRVVSYQLGMFNGAGPAVPIDDNTDFLYAARLVLSPLGPVPHTEGDLEHGPLRVSVGAAFVFNLQPTDILLREGVTDPARVAEKLDGDGDGDVDNISVYTLGTELAARYRGVTLQGEMFYRVEDPGTAAASRTFWGAYGQTSYFLQSANLELGARYGFWEPPNFGVDRTVLRPGRIHEVSAVIAGLAWRRLIKWQAEYSHQWLDEIEAPAADELTGTQPIRLHQVRLQLQLAF